MATLTIEIPDTKKVDVSKYVKQIGGHVINKTSDTEVKITDEDEVTHESFFGENIRRVIKAFSNNK